LSTALLRFSQPVGLNIWRSSLVEKTAKLHKPLMEESCAAANVPPRNTDEAVAAGPIGSTTVFGKLTLVTG
jgi:hypothetical protein